MKSGAGSPGASRSSLTRAPFDVRLIPPVIRPDQRYRARTGRAFGSSPRVPSGFRWPANLRAMNAFSPYSPLKGGRAQRHAAAVALGAGALALIAGCSGAGSSAGSGGAAAKPLSPHTALTLAADQSERVNSIDATFSSQLGGSVSETTTGSMQIQLKPTLVAENDLKVTTGGQTTPMDEIITPKALYLKSGLPSLGTSAAKPWLEIDYACLKGSQGSALSSLLQNAQNSNPATQTQMLAASKNVHEVGTQVMTASRPPTTRARSRPRPPSPPCRRACASPSARS